MNHLRYQSSIAKSVMRVGLLLDSKLLFSKLKCFSKVLQTENESLRYLSVKNYVTALNISVKRSYATKSSRRPIPKRFKKPRLPFETDSSATSNVLLFTFHGRERLCLLISLGGLFLFCALLNSSELIYMTLNRIRPQPSSDEKYPWYYWWRYIKFESNIVKYGASGFVFCFAFAVLGFSLVYPTRMIREVSLMKGGEKVLLQTYRPFGFTKSYELDLKDISAQWGPSEAKDYLPLKLRGKRFPLLLNQDGMYQNQRLFDQTVGLYRF